MPHSYTEDQLVEQPAIGLFGELGWQTASAMEEVFGASGTLARESPGEVVLTTRLAASLKCLNPSLPPEAIAVAIDELSRDRSAMLPEQANREIYTLIKEGIRVTIPDREQGGQKTERLRVIEWDDFSKNDFLLVSQLSITGQLYTCRPDLIGFINGLPMVVIELKKPGVPPRSAFDDNLSHYKQQIPSLFWYNAFLIASNGTESRIGSLTADWERFFEWKRIESEQESRRVSLEVMIRGTCEKSRLLDLIENFALFSEHKSGLAKVIGQNHQFLGVNNAIGSMLEARAKGNGQAGVFWHTQGSGKSLSMVFFSQKVLRKHTGNWTFVIVTDRVELDEQIAKTFKATGAVSEAEGDICHATSGTHLRALLRGNHRYVFTLIHKFLTPELLSDRSDIVVITDEAHRSQYDTLAVNMRSALPKALFIAFTGTPLIVGEERTKNVFGDYVSIYDFQQSVEDGATVPLFYENRTPELQLVNPELNEDIYSVIEEAELDPEQEAKLERELSRQYHIITRDDRLDTVAKDIVHHYLGRGFLGKAMVVSIDKATALKMYTKVQHFWALEKERVVNALKGTGGLTETDRIALIQRLKVLESTDMALIVSSGQNEIEQMKEHGLDIVPHRKRMNESEPPLDEKFKDPADPLGIVFLCAMWLTGFDAPSCSVVYLDKPMRNHTLMQTIARANRVYPGKHSGLIVDYANVFTSLEAALAIYGVGQGGMRPVQDKQILIQALREALGVAEKFCQAHGVDIKAIEGLQPGGFDRLGKIDNAINSLISPDGVRREFLGHERMVRTLYGAVKPDPIVWEFAGRVSCLGAIAEGIRAKLDPRPADIASVMGKIIGILDVSIVGISEPKALGPKIDLSKVDFASLKKRFEASEKKNTDLEILKAAVRAQMERLLQLNRTRADFQEKFEDLIASYNAGSRNIEDLFEQLVRLSQALSEEEQRHVKENMTEEELVIFDILTRPAPALTAEERSEIKKVARRLLGRVKELLVLNWRQKSSARSKLILTIEDELEGGLPSTYSTELYHQKCSAVFEHVYESYPERGTNPYV